MDLKTEETLEPKDVCGDCICCGGLNVKMAMPVIAMAVIKRANKKRKCGRGIVCTEKANDLQ